MSPRENGPRAGGKPPYVILVAIVLLILPVGYSAAARLLGAGGPTPLFERPAAEHTKCVRDTAYMRYRHMDLLKELRDAGVRGGARRQLTFDDCRRCHPSRVKFCNRCHDKVNLHPDCFGCHYYPE